MIYKIYKDEIKESNYLFELDEKLVKFYNIIKQKEKYYSICRIRYKKRVAKVEELHFSKEGKKHHYKDKMTCPHCNYEHEDPDEIEGNSGAIYCDRCGIEFLFERIISVEYTSKPIDQEIDIIEVEE